MNGAMLLKEFQDPDLEALRMDILQAAVVYSRIRTDWYFLSTEERREKDVSRTRAHNAFIDCCNVLARYQRKCGMSPVWRDDLGEDRKRIGDFACELHASLGVAMR
jgi:hypothetical protein